MIGQTLQNYTFKNILGQGGMARVYLAENHKFNTPVAIKVLNKEFIHNDNIRKRFLSEARNLFKMNHPNIVRVTDMIEEDDTVAFVMEYIEGKTLKDYLEDKGKLSDKEITNLFAQMLEAVGYVHEQNLVHRDIKPSNFMLSNAGVVKLMDFGIAKNLDPSSAEHTVTGTSKIMGTPMYMSPEQIKSTKDVTPQSDIYSLGVVLWQMVTGRKPYDSSITSTFEIQSKIVNEPLPLTNTKWDKLIQSCTQKEKSARFKSIAEVKKSLKTNRSNNSKKEESRSETTVYEEQPHKEQSKSEPTVIEEKTPSEKPPGWVSYSDSFPKNENQSKESIKREFKSEIVAEGSSNRGKIILWISILSIVIVGAIIISKCVTTSIFGQRGKVNTAFNYKESGEILKAYQAIQEAIDPTNVKTEKSITWPLTWIVRGQILQEAYKKGTTGLVDEPLFAAYDSYVKAIEYDEGNKYGKSIIVDLTFLQTDLGNYAIASYEKQRFDISLKCFETYLAISALPIMNSEKGQTAVDTAVIYNAGLAAYEAQIWDKAIEYLKKSSKYDFNGATSCYYAYLAYKMKNDNINGLAFLKESLKKYPDNELLKTELNNYFIDR